MNFEVTFKAAYRWKPEFGEDETLRRNSCTAQELRIAAFSEPAPGWIRRLCSLFISSETVP
ncbi:MAG: hypothetical protein KDA65_10000 [Planctomycetaceae bacterium]|nr:hypothetical protein [Planctomycetaceae bacterium]